MVSVILTLTEMVSLSFYLFSLVIKVGREKCLNLRNWQILQIFGRCCQFPQDFEQVLLWLILHLIKIIRFFSSCLSNCFSPLCHRYRQRGVVKLKKNGHFQAFLDIILHSSKTLNGSVCNLHYICKKWWELYFRVVFVSSFFVSMIQVSK